VKLLDHDKVSNRQSEPQTIEDRVTQYSEDTFPNVHEPAGKKPEEAASDRKCATETKAST